MKQFLFRENTIYCGDNLEVLKCFPDECANLIYIDPPFFSNRNYEIIWGDGYEIRSFEDRWEGGIEHYIDWMRPRIEELYRVLKRTGSFYLHCDWHSDAYLRILCDQIFKIEPLSVIYWKRTNAKGRASRKFNVNSDTILLYVKSDNYTFNPQMVDSIAKQDTLSDSYGNFVTHDISRRKRGTIGKTRIIEEKTITLDAEHSWLWTQDRINKYESDGYTFYWTKNGIPRYKQYIDEGVACDNIWIDLYLDPNSKERLGYPTQKPEALLERIIHASSNEGDLVLDSFSGCGTSLEASINLKRRFIGIDISPTACKLMAKRIDYPLGNIIGMPYTIEELRALPHFEFQNWVVMKLGGRISTKKTSDFGIDGTIPLEGNIPIQVKQSDNVSRPEIDKFETTIKRLKKRKGYFIAFSFTKGSIEEIARCKNQEGIEIVYIPIEKLAEPKNTTP